jgi:hypothetical protein
VFLRNLGSNLHDGRCDKQEEAEAADEIISTRGETDTIRYYIRAISKKGA